MHKLLREQKYCETSALEAIELEIKKCDRYFELVKWHMYIYTYTYIYTFLLLLGKSNIKNKKIFNFFFYQQV